MASYGLTLNGTSRQIDSDDPEKPLLYALRGDLGLNGPKFGCGLGQCGACTVLLDGDAQRSCLVTVADAAGKTVITLEGLGTPERPHPIQVAFIAEQAAQCGYCTNGMIMTAKAFLDRTPEPSEDAVKDMLAANLCRCGTHRRIIRAVLRAAGRPQP